MIGTNCFWEAKLNHLGGRERPFGGKRETTGGHDKTKQGAKVNHYGGAFKPIERKRFGGGGKEKPIGYGEAVQGEPWNGPHGIFISLGGRGKGRISGRRKKNTFSESETKKSGAK